MLENTMAETTEPTNSAAALSLSAGAEQGLAELVGKLDPLLAGGRLNRIVDLMSVIADVVDMTDDYMLEKLCKAYEEGIGGLWSAGHLAKMAGNQVSQMSEPPNRWELIKMTKDPEVRRGIAFLLLLAQGIGKRNSIALTDD